MDLRCSDCVQRLPGADEFVTVTAQALSFKKARIGRLHNKNDHGLGIAFAAGDDPDSEHLEAGREYEINLHFTEQAVDGSLEPYISRQAGLFVFTFSGVCKHVTPHATGTLVAGFDLQGDIPGPVLEFLKKTIPRTPPQPPSLCATGRIV